MKKLKDKWTLAAVVCFVLLATADSTGLAGMLGRFAGKTCPEPALAGHWQSVVGENELTGFNAPDSNKIVFDLRIDQSRNIQGKLGNAVLKDQRIYKNRSWLKRLFAIGPDYTLKGWLTGNISAQDHTAKRFVTIGCTIKGATLWANPLELRRWAPDTPLLKHTAVLRKAKN